MDQKQRWDTLDQIGGMKNAKTVSPRERILMMKESRNDACRRKSTAKEQRLVWEKAQESLPKENRCYPLYEFHLGFARG